LFSGIKLQMLKQLLIKPKSEQRLIKHNEQELSERLRETNHNKNTERQRMIPRDAFFMGVLSVVFRAAISCHDTCLFGRSSAYLTICFCY
jgi:rRNA pseudouridine-1189 N-methylase Emg1 (Nep1/Mra1 family)